jgi:hypothetical protein
LAEYDPIIASQNKKHNNDLADYNNNISSQIIIEKKRFGRV